MPPQAYLQKFQPKILDYYITSYYNTSMNQTIYFRKKIWDSLKDEPKKSKLINHLLEEHYKDGHIAKASPAKYEHKISPAIEAAITFGEEVANHKHKEQEKAKQSAFKTESVFSRAAPKFCKHEQVKGFCKQGCK